MIEWYQHLPEHIHPIIVTIGFFSLYWYAVMYMLALTVSTVVLWRMVRDWLGFDQYVDLVFDLVLGILVGSRIGYVVLYNFSFYAAHPLSIVWPFDTRTGAWTGIAGMSFYGGLIGACIGVRLFAKRQDISFWKVTDVLAFAVPIGYFFGRLGNFLNGELYGRITEKAWGMYFPEDSDGGMALRHPSQLYEAFFEGVILWCVLMFVKNRCHFSGAISAVYVIGYGALRFFIEFFREPDPQMQLFFGWMTLSQSISIGVCLFGAVLFFRFRTAMV